MILWARPAIRGIDAGQGSDERGVVLLRRRRGADRREPSAASDRRLTNASLAELDARFSSLTTDRASLDPPEQLLRATLLQLLLIRSERQLVERLEFDMLFRWFVGLSIDEKVFDASTFSKNRDRLLTHEIAQEFLSSLLGLPEVKGLLSAEHFSVDGTMLKAWASMKSFRPKSASGEGPGNGPGEPPPPGRNREADFRKTKNRTRRAPRRRTRTHAYSARRRAREPSLLSRPCADGEPRRACGGGRATLATGTAEREAAAGFQPALALWRDARGRQGL